jgi:hypothetical protein
MAIEEIRMCPNCGYEYESWVEICPDCGTLVETVPRDPKVEVIPGALDPGEDPRWTVVTNVPNAIIGNFLKTQLQDAGIPVLMERSPSADIAFFSHNDFVPYDLRVPLHMVAEARRILDSRPDRSAGAPYWGTGLDEDEPEEPEYNPFASFETQSPSSNLPEGWHMLPTERDLRARQQHQRSHGADTGDWYRSDSTARASDKKPLIAPEEDEYEQDDEPLEIDKERFSGYYDPYEDEGLSGRTNWVRIVYGILIAALTLPFILQLLQQIATFFDFDK